MPDKLVIYTDGGARGNPGPAAIGVVFPELGKEHGEQIGIATNNVAEYRAVIFALKKAKQLIGSEKSKETEIEILSDSKLVVSQMKCEYKIKDENLKPLFIDVWNLTQGFKKVSFAYIPREENSRADALVNRELDIHLAEKLF